MWSHTFLLPNELSLLTLLCSPSSWHNGTRASALLAVPTTTTTTPSCRLAERNFSLIFDSQRSRDLAALCVRTFAGPNCPTHAETHPSGAFDDTLGEHGDADGNIVADDEGADPPAQIDSTVSNYALDEADAELKGVMWSDEEAQGEEEEFKPAMEVKIRSR